MIVRNEKAYTIVFLKNTSTPGPAVSVVGNLQPSFQLNLSSSYSAPFDLNFDSAILQGFRVLTGIAPKHQAQTAQIWQGSEVPSFTVTINLETESDINNDIRTQILNLMSFVSPTESRPSGMIHSPQYISYQRIKSMWDNQKTSISDSYKAEEEARSLKSQANQETKQKEKNKVTGQLTDGKTPNTEQQQSDATESKLADRIASTVEGDIQIKIGKYLEFPHCVVTDVNFDIKSIMDYSSGYPQSAEVQVTFKPLMLPLIEDWKKILLPVNDTLSQQIAENKNNGLVGQIVGTATSAINGVSNTVNSTIAKGAERVNSWTNSLFS